MTHGRCLSTDPRLTDYDLLLENINGLRAGKDVEIPIYDFKLSRRVGFRFGSVSDASLTAFHILHFSYVVISPGA